MYFEHIYEKGLAQASYLVGCQVTGESIVIDPRRDIDVYLEIAERENLRITHVSETHIHADFLSGSRELAASTGAQLMLSDEGGSDWQYGFDHHGLKDGHTIGIGNLAFRVLHTPGHTPEHISFLLTDTPVSDRPIMLFSGDFVFVGDVGRPDLLEIAAGIKGTREVGARQMFDSLKRFKALPDHVQVWPGHGAGSACGKSLGAVPSSTVGYEKLVNWAVKTESEKVFVDKLLDGQPEPPRYFGNMKKMNKEGPAVLGRLPQPVMLTEEQLVKAVEDGTAVIDARSKEDFCEAHIPGTLCIPHNSSFSTWAGWLMDYNKPILLIAPSEKVEELTRRLVRIGLDDIAGYFPDVTGWTARTRQTKKIAHWTSHQINDGLDSDSVFVLDVRGAAEYEEVRIKNATNIHLGHLTSRIGSLPRNITIAVQCRTGVRSVIGASILAKHGFENVVNLEGGIEAWTESGLPVETGLRVIA